MICLFDVSKGSEDDALDSVLNTGSSVVCVKLPFNFQPISRPRWGVGGDAGESKLLASHTPLLFLPPFLAPPNIYPLLLDNIGFFFLLILPLSVILQMLLFTLFQPHSPVVPCCLSSMFMPPLFSQVPEPLSPSTVEGK